MIISDNGNRVYEDVKIIRVAPRLTTDTCVVIVETASKESDVRKTIELHLKSVEIDKLQKAFLIDPIITLELYGKEVFLHIMNPHFNKTYNAEIYDMKEFS